MKHCTDEAEDSTPKKYRLTTTVSEEARVITRAGGSAAVTPSPQVVRGIGNRGTEEQSTSRALWKRLDFQECHNASVDERLDGDATEEGSGNGNGQQQRGTNLATPTSTRKSTESRSKVQLNLNVMMKQTKPFPKDSEIVVFKAHTVLPPREISNEDTSKALEHLRLYCLAPESLHIRMNDNVVLTHSLSDNLTIGTTGTVAGWKSIGDVRLGLTGHIAEVKSHPQDYLQSDFESDVSHKHAVDITPSPFYPVVKFKGRDEVEEERVILPEAFNDTVPEIGALIRCQLPLLRVPKCRCRPGAFARLLHCHNGGPNHGRWFFSCPKAIGEQCGYFMWKTAKVKASTANTSKAEIHEE